MRTQLNKIIRENIKKVLLEMDIVPTNDKGEINRVLNKSVNEWRMIYRFMDNVKMAMDAIIEGKKKYNEHGDVISTNSITSKDVDNILNYIIDGLKNIKKQ